MEEQTATLQGTIQSEGALVGRVVTPQFVGGGDVPIMSETVAGIAKVGDNLKIDDAGRLSVDTADTVEGDNTRPITAAAVYATVGNIE
ncbi:MAG: hypothetical protein IJF49_08535, partial [Clostridia bacterium]|nr:hypothetical protein [Clostridia bacterium]